ncbi:MAG: S4 domain-containing protein, partial [Streptococcus parauberis]
MRIDKLLEEEGIGSRNQVKTLIKSQQVKVNEQ